MNVCSLEKSANISKNVDTKQKGMVSWNEESCFGS